jgi:glycosidase
MYYGEEIGMTDGALPYETALDPIPHLYPGLSRGLVNLADETLNRDDVRTPMQWDSTRNAGFSTAGRTWLPVNGDFQKINVAQEQKSAVSLLNFIKSIMALRNSMPVFSRGSLELLPKGLPAGVLGYKRKLGDSEVIVLLNFSGSAKLIQVQGEFKSALSIHEADGFDDTTAKVTLSPYGGIILSRILSCPHYE